MFKIANSNNRSYLNASSLMLDINDPKFDTLSEDLRAVKKPE